MDFYITEDWNRKLSVLSFLEWTSSILRLGYHSSLKSSLHEKRGGEGEGGRCKLLSSLYSKKFLIIFLISFLKMPQNSIDM